jgi:hypothetical protein
VISNREGNVLLEDSAIMALTSAALNGNDAIKTVVIDQWGPV